MPRSASASRRAHDAAAARQLDAWLDDPTGALALMILLDQFPAMPHRGTAHMFATDPLAQYFADHAIAAGHDLAVDPPLRQFFYLPFEHAESLAAQNRAVALMGDAGCGVAAVGGAAPGHHQALGRFPHRNAALGRQTSQAEQEFLESGGFAG